MIVLNLTKGFTPYKNDSEITGEIEFESFIFNGGEPHIRLTSNNWNNEDVMITSRVKSFNDIGMILTAINAIQNHDSGFESISLFIPYFPAARQDRICNDGEALTVKVYSDLINTLELEEVIMFDSHSEVAPALVNYSSNYNNHDFVLECIKRIYKSSCFESDMLIVSPDAGANKKINQLCQDIDYVENPIIKCDKKRDILTGKLSGFKVYSSNLKGKDCIIVDDIADGGGTFIGLAKEFKKKKAGDIYLIVSHGIFSKGFKELSKYFKAIYTTNSWVNNYAMEIPEHEKGSEIVNIIKFNEFIS